MHLSLLGSFSLFRPQRTMIGSKRKTGLCTVYVDERVCYLKAYGVITAEMKM